jgi:hypothetical protein
MEMIFLKICGLRLTIGVFGQYIGSLFDEVKNRPEYIIAGET